MVLGRVNYIRETLPQTEAVKGAEWTHAGEPCLEVLKRLACGRKVTLAATTHAGDQA